MNYEQMSIDEIEAAKREMYHQQQHLRGEMRRADEVMNRKINEQRQREALAAEGNSGNTVVAGSAATAHGGAH